MKIWAVRQEYLNTLCADIDTIREAVDFFDELAEEHNREEIRMFSNEYDTSFEIRIESIDFVYGDTEILDDVILFKSELYSFLNEVKELFDANNGMSSLFLQVE